MRRTPRVYPRDRDRHPADLAEQQERRSERLRSCRNPPGCPGSRAALAPMVRKLCAARAPFSPRSRRGVRQYPYGVLLGQRPGARLTLRLPERRDARCVGPTSAISFSRTSTRASPVPVCVLALACPAPSEKCLIRRQCNPLWRSTRCVLATPQRALSSRRGACGSASDTPVASPALPATLARSRALPGPPRPRLCPPA